MNTDFTHIWKYRKYLFYAAKFELKSEVSNAYLDWFWWILEPLFNMLIYYLIFGIVFRTPEKYFMVFIYSSLTMWNFFSRTVMVSVQLIRFSKPIITKVYIPKSVLLLEKMLVNAFKMAISSVIVVIMMILYKVPVDYHLLALPYVLIIFYIFTFGCGCILMHLGAYISDLSYIISLALNMLIYFTGIFYSIGERFPAPWGKIFELCNPLAFMIAQMRNCLLHKHSIISPAMLCWTIISFIMALIGSHIVSKYENSYAKVI